MSEIAHQRRAGLAARHMARRTAHIEIDNFGTRGLGDPSALRHPFDLAARELDHVRAYAGRFASQPRHWAAIDEVIARSHLGNDQSGAEGCGQTSKGCVSDAGHRREKDPIGDLNVAYFQWLKA